MHTTNAASCKHFDTHQIRNDYGASYGGATIPALAQYIRQIATRRFHCRFERLRALMIFADCGAACQWLQFGRIQTDFDATVNNGYRRWYRTLFQRLWKIIFDALKCMVMVNDGNYLFAYDVLNS